MKKVSKKVRQGLLHRTILIDAHNLCYAQSHIRQTMLNDPESARQQLERFIGGHARYLLFYDGGPHGEPRVLERNGLKVYYSGQGSADDVIIMWLKTHLNNQAVLISDDRGLRARAQQSGALLCFCGEFLTALSHTRQQRVGQEKPEHLPSPQEVDMYMEIFADEEDSP